MFSDRSVVAFRLVQGFYYLALGTWFGATLMAGVSAASAFRTLRAARPTVSTGPTALPEFAEYTAEYIAGNAVNPAFSVLAGVQGVCAVVLLAALVLQGTSFRDRLMRRGRTWTNAVRVVLVALPLLILTIDVATSRAQMNALRPTMYDATEAPEARAEARERFDAAHKRSERAIGASALLLALAAVVSPFAFVSGRDGLEVSADG